MHYSPVVGRNKLGEIVEVAVGDLVAGIDDLGRYVFGKVIATHPYYPSVTIYGATFGRVGEAATSSRWDLHLDKILSHHEAPESVRLNT